MKEPICVYVAGPIQGATTLVTLRNLDAGLRAEAQLRDMGFAPFPVFSDFLSIMRTQNINIADIYAQSLVWMRRADVVCMLPGWETSKGATRELIEALRCGIPVTYGIDQLVEWRQSRDEKA